MHVSYLSFRLLHKNVLFYVPLDCDIDNFLGAFTSAPYQSMIYK